NRPENIEPTRRRRLRFAEAEERSLTRLTQLQSRTQLFKRLRNLLLMRVAGQPPFGDSGAITLKRPLGHQSHSQEKGPQRAGQWLICSRWRRSTRQWARR